MQDYGKFYDRINERAKNSNLHNILFRYVVSNSQVGIMFQGTMIDSVVFGGPAHSTQKLSRGDFVTMVDGVPATDRNLTDLLSMNDRPGVSVSVVVAKGGDQVDFF